MTCVHFIHVHSLVILSFLTLNAFEFSFYHDGRFGLNKTSKTNKIPPNKKKRGVKSIPVPLGAPVAYSSKMFVDKSGKRAAGRLSNNLYRGLMSQTVHWK